MQSCAECMPDFAKCQTAEQVPRAQERVFSFPASHSLAWCLSSKAGGGDWKSKRLAGAPCHSVCLGWLPELGEGRESHHHSAVFTALSQSIIKPTSGVSTPSFLQKV